jgi:hypothetical protein
MCKFPIRYFIALLTFIIGVSAVSVWHQSQTTQEVQFAPANVRQELTPHIQKNLSDSWETYFGEPLVWKFLLNDDYYGKIAVVRATGETSNGQVRAKLKLDCPGRDSALTIIVGDMEKSGFNLGNYSVKSDSPVAKKNLVEVRAVSPKGELSFKTKAEGRIGYENLYPTVLFFELTKTKKLERLIAKGSAEVAFVIHDLEDYQKTIRVTFPAIDSSSQMAKDLKGCR